MIEEAHNWRWALYVALFIAAASDIRTYRIPNWIPLAAASALLVVLIATVAGPSAYLAASQSALIGLGAGYLLFAARVMGAGDGKLFAAASAWFQPSGLLTLALAIALAGAAVSLLLLCFRILRARTVGTARLSDALATKVPYGVAISIGAFATAEFAI